MPHLGRRLSNPTGDPCPLRIPALLLGELDPCANWLHVLWRFDALRLLNVGDDQKAIGLVIFCKICHQSKPFRGLMYLSVPSSPK
jgi:hypothetical protein